jgi:hypothetical protein
MDLLLEEALDQREYVVATSALRRDHIPGAKEAMPRI